MPGDAQFPYLPPDEEAQRMHEAATKRVDDALIRAAGVSAADVALPTDETRRFEFPKMRPARRRVVIALEPERVAEGLRLLHPSLPADLRALGGSYDPVRGTFNVLVESATFAETPPGECYPEVRP